MGLPPLVGYLIAGFVLYGAGMQATVTLREFAEIGVSLLLFSIGLKLRVGNLLMPQVWALASLQWCYWWPLFWVWDLSAFRYWQVAMFSRRH